MTIGDVSTPVVILRLDHHGALGIARSLGRLGVAVYGVHFSDRAPAFRSRYCRRGYVWDLDNSPPDASVRFLLDIARQIGGRAILLPSNDETAIFIADHSEALRERFLFPATHKALVRSLIDKQTMALLAKDAGIPTPQSVLPNSRESVEQFCRSAQFPVMLKASDGISVARRAGKKMVIARTKNELLAGYDEMANPLHPDLMLQEYIPGGDDSVWMFNGYFDENSDCLTGFTGKKIHQYPVYTGMTSLGICLKNDTVDQLTRRFMRAIGYKGILDIGYRYDARDGLYKVLDVNPRVGATFRLFVGENGMDVVRALYLHLTGQPVPSAAVCEGRKWLVEDLDLISSIRYFCDRAFGIGEWLGSYGNIREAAWFAKDDMKPFAHMCAGLISRSFRKMSRRLHARLQPQIVGRVSAGD